MYNRFPSVNSIVSLLINLKLQFNLIGLRNSVNFLCVQFNDVGTEYSRKIDIIYNMRIEVLRVLCPNLLFD